MSSFQCEHCGTNILDGDKGYYTGCEHYPLVSNMIKGERKQHKKEKDKTKYHKPTLRDMFP